MKGIKKMKLNYGYFKLALFVAFTSINICYASFVDQEEIKNTGAQKTQIQGSNEPSDETLDSGKQLSLTPEVALTTVYDLSDEIWAKISSFLDNKTIRLHHLNRHFFTLVTNYPLADIDKVGTKHHLTLPPRSLSKFKGIHIDFEKIHFTQIDKMPNYLWSSLVDSIAYLPTSYWGDLKNTRISYIRYDENMLDAWSVETLGRALAGTPVQNADLGMNTIGNMGAFRFVKTLKDTNVQIVNLSWNQINDAGAFDFCRELPATQVHTVDLGGNKITPIVQILLILNYPSVKFRF